MKAHTQETCQPLDWNQAQKALKASGYDVTNMENETKKLRLARMRLMFACGIYFGLRASDLLKLSWRDIEDKTLTITENKTGKKREITINQDLMRVIWDTYKLIDPESDLEFLLPAEQTEENRPVQVQTFNTKLKRFIQVYVGENATYTSHTLRKTFGRRVYENNKQSENALILLSQIFNHSTLGITRRYIGLTQERIADVYLSL